MDVLAAVRQSFFDRDLVMKRVASAKRRAITKQLVYIRVRAKTSIRKRRISSPAGQPPSSHAGQLRLIFFGWDSATESGVVGPVPFASKTGGSARVPRLLEEGGDVTSTRPNGLTRTAHYQGNPFMGPAEQAERPNFASQFANEV